MSAAKTTTSPKGEGRCAIALGASFLGYFAHAGFLTGMDACGVRPVAISGSSAGAIAGGLFSAGVRGDSLRELLCSKRFMDSFFDFGMSLRIPAVLLGAKDAGFLHGQGAVDLIRGVTDNAQIEDLADPAFFPAVTDLDASESLVLRSGDLASAVVASASIPGMMRPQEMGGRKFYDGGVTNEAPIDQWMEDDSIDEIIIHRVLHEGRATTSAEPDRPAAGLLRYPYAACHQLVSDKLLDYRLRLAEALGKKVTTVITSHQRPGLLPFRKAPSFFQAGEATAHGLWN